MENRLQSGVGRLGLKLRLKAGALASAFLALTLLPWLHIFTAGEHAGHAGCAALHRLPVSSDSAPTLALADAVDSCWICQSLFALLQHSAASGTPQDVCVAAKTPFVAHAPQAFVIRFVDPATRSQAPPAHV